MDKYYLYLNPMAQKRCRATQYIAMMFWMSTFLQNIRTSFVQQPIVELFLGHLTLEEREELVDANNTKGKNDKSQILIYQLLNILIKCLMFCKMSLYNFYLPQNWDFSTSCILWTWIFLGIHPKTKISTCVKTTLSPPTSKKLKKPLDANIF